MTLLQDQALVSKACHHVDVVLAYHPPQAVPFGRYLQVRGVSLFLSVFSVVFVCLLFFFRGGGGVLADFDVESKGSRGPKIEILQIHKINDIHVKYTLTWVLP